MRKNFPVVFAVAILFIVLSVGASSVFAQGYSAPARTLRLGDTGNDVLLLQILLNKNPATMVAQSGIGSPGFESNYFGPKTVSAVKRFQNIHAPEVLYSQGLTYPTGFVGTATLGALQSFVKGLATTAGATIPIPTTVLPTTPGVIVPTPSVPVVIKPVSKSVVSQAPANISALVSPAKQSSVSNLIPLKQAMDIPAGTNTNLYNIEYVVSNIKELGKTQGMNDSQLNILESSIRAAAASTTDFRKKFFENGNFISMSSSMIKVPTVADGFFVRVLSYLGLVNIAKADGGMPFGGEILSVIPCTCDPNIWLLTVNDVGPSHAKFLSYETGTQMYLNSNLPFSPLLLGFYTPGVQVCFMIAGDGCAPAPNQGLITPVVGSA